MARSPSKNTLGPLKACRSRKSGRGGKDGYSLDASVSSHSPSLRDRPRISQTRGEPNLDRSSSPHPSFQFLKKTPKMLFDTCQNLSSIPLASPHPHRPHPRRLPLRSPSLPPPLPRHVHLPNPNSPGHVHLLHSTRPRESPAVSPRLSPTPLRASYRSR